MFNIFESELDQKTARFLVYGYVTGIFEFLPMEVYVEACKYESGSLAKTLYTILEDFNFRMCVNVGDELLSETIQIIRQKYVCETPESEHSEYTKDGRKIDIFLGPYPYRPKVISKHTNVYLSKNNTPFHRVMNRQNLMDIHEILALKVRL